MNRRTDSGIPDSPAELVADLALADVVAIAVAARNAHPDNMPLVNCARAVVEAGTVGHALVAARWHQQRSPFNRPLADLAFDIHNRLKRL